MSKFLQERITSIKSRIVACEEACLYLLQNPTKSYTLDTGQSEQKVTYQDIESIQKMLDGLLNQLTVYEKRCSNTAEMYIPGF